jgi:gliding motility-associated lipoprotein GldH
MYYKNNNILGLFILLMAMLSSCKRLAHYEQKNYLSHNQWQYKDVQKFQFKIKDTSSKYNFSFLMQHGDAYPFANIWFQLITQFPSGKIDSTRVEVPLALIDGMWLGRHAAGRTEHIMNIAPNAGTMQFKEAGNYNITIIQDMRLDTLIDVQYIGMKLEKAP